MTKVTKGIFWILGPWFSLILVLVIWAVVSFVLGSVMSGGASGDSLLVAARMINVVLGFVGMISVFAIPVGLIVGIVLFATSKKGEAPPQDAPQPPTDQTPA